MGVNDKVAASMFPETSLPETPVVHALRLRQEIDSFIDKWMIATRALTHYEYLEYQRAYYGFAEKD